MACPRNVFLIGYRGTGKSTVAALLADRLTWDWQDTDDEIERRAGQTIAQIFAQQGEEGFRDLESQVLGDLARQEHVVLALGGGAVLRSENRQVLSERGAAVWLTAPAETLWARITADSSTEARRPNLTNLGPLKEIERLLEARAPIYGACATMTIATQDKSPAQVADEIWRVLTRPFSEKA